MLGKFLDVVAGMYQRAVAKRLAKYGLRYEDLLIETPEVLEATARLPKHEIHARNMRWARAQDLDMKKKTLHGEAYEKALKEAIQPYMAPYLSRARLEAREKQLWK
eukprot:c33463_g1_i1.p1 GENE.c33463_g1_i1~~c33463_g1_i1.p1  ORF type:complete len:106 (+),score=34.05 c33463_g1_i1:39-356(+)